MSKNIQCRSVQKTLKGDWCCRRGRKIGIVVVTREQIKRNGDWGRGRTVGKWYITWWPLKQLNRRMNPYNHPRKNPDKGFCLFWSLQQLMFLMWSNNYYKLNILPQLGKITKKLLSLTITRLTYHSIYIIIKWNRNNNFKAVTVSTSYEQCGRNYGNNKCCPKILTAPWSVVQITPSKLWQASELEDKYQFSWMVSS